MNFNLKWPQKRTMKKLLENNHKECIMQMILSKNLHFILLMYWYCFYMYLFLRRCIDLALHKVQQKERQPITLLISFTLFLLLLTFISFVLFSLTLGQQNWSIIDLQTSLLCLCLSLSLSLSLSGRFFLTYHQPLHLSSLIIYFQMTKFKVNKNEFNKFNQ